MHTKKLFSVYGLTLVILLSQFLSFSASASPRNQNSTLTKTKVSEDTKQLHAAYEALLVEFERKSATVKASSKTKKTKAKLVKASLSSYSNADYEKSLRVTATAYTSHANQTDSTPNIAAWGDRLHP